jgi:hypothetical protein
MKMRLKDKIEWRRDQIQQLQAKGYHTVREIANILQIPRATVGKDILYLRQEAKANIRKYIDERLPEEYEKIMVGLNSILQESWETSEQPDIDTREKLQALSLAKECYSMKLDLLTNATVIDDASSFVARHKDKNKDKADDKDKEAESKDVIKEEESTIANDTVNKVF